MILLFKIIRKGDFLEKNRVYISKHAELNVEYKYTVEESTTFSIFAKSYGFFGEHSFCIRNFDLERITSELNNISNSLSGKCTINDTDSDSFICIVFECKKLKILGQLGGSHADNLMKFSFFADQTVAKLLADNFRTFIGI